MLVARGCTCKHQHELIGNECRQLETFPADGALTPWHSRVYRNLGLSLYSSPPLPHKSTPTLILHAQYGPNYRILDKASSLHICWGSAQHLADIRPDLLTWRVRDSFRLELIAQRLRPT